MIDAPFSGYSHLGERYRGGWVNDARYRRYIEETMLVCNACHRHYRAQDGQCPFCGAGLRTTEAPTTRAPIMGAAALALGLSLFACGEKGEEGEEETTGDETTTDDTETDSSGTDTDTTTEEDTDTSTADYAGPDTGFEETDTGTDTTTETTEEGGSDYGGAPPPDPSLPK